MKKLILIGLVYLMVHIPYQEYLPLASSAIPLLSIKECSTHPDGQCLFFASEKDGASFPYQTKSMYEAVSTRIRNIFNGHDKVYEIKLKIFGIRVQITLGNDLNNKANR